MHLKLKSFTAVLLVALGVATISAWFTINGMIALFSGAINSIVAMVIALEVGKITIAGWLILGHKTKLKIPLLVIMFALMGIAGGGHFGFLSEAYNEERAVQTRTEGKIGRLERQIKMLEDRDADLQTLVDRTPENYVTRRWQIWQEVAPEQEKIHKQLDSLYTVRDNLADEELEVNLSIGPYRHIAALFGTTQDKIARFIALVLSLIIDPLAILLIMAGSSYAGKVTPNLSSVTPNLSGFTPNLSRPRKRKRHSLFTGRKKKRQASQTDENTDRDTVTTIALGGSTHHAIYKLATVIKYPGPVHLYLSPELSVLTSICRLLPNVRRVDKATAGTVDIDLTENIPLVHGAWIGSHYTNPDEWFGLGRAILEDTPVGTSELVFLSLGDYELEQRLHDSDKGPNIKLGGKEDDLLDTLKTAANCRKRVVAVGILGAIMEFAGLSHIVWPGKYSDKVLDMYILPSAQTVSSESELISELF